MEPPVYLPINRQPLSKECNSFFPNVLCFETNSADVNPKLNFFFEFLVHRIFERIAANDCNIANRVIFFYRGDPYFSD